MWKLASFIYERRRVQARAKAALAFAHNIIVRQQKLTELEMVVFLHDCYCRALGKSLKLKRGEGVSGKITRAWKDYDNFVLVIPLITQFKINPFAFFIYTITTRQNRNIPPKLNNVVTPNAVQHYLNYLKSNSYRVSTYATNRDYEAQLYSQFDVDLTTLVTLLLRKSKASFGNSDIFVFSSWSKALLVVGGHLKIELSPEENIFAEDLMFDPIFTKRVKGKWNTSIDIQTSRVQSLAHELREDYFTAKIGEILLILLSFKLL